MKIPALVPSALCVVAGVLLVFYTMANMATGSDGDRKLDVFFICTGMYFIGKGLFISSILSMLREFKNNR